MPKTQGAEKLKQLLSAFERAHIDKPDTQPSWDTSGALKHTFINSLFKWLPQQSDDFKTLIEYGTVRFEKQFAVSSFEHAVSLQSDTVPKGTAEAPSPLRFKLPTVAI